MGSKKVYICRHGQTEGNVAKVIQGWQDGKLTTKGREQALETGRMLAKRGIELIVCGDLGRQKETAKGILQYVDAPVIYSRFLRERGAGSLEGKTYASLGIDEETDFDCYASDGSGILAPIESFESVTDRAFDLVDGLIALPHEVILTIGSGWINSYIANILAQEDWTFHDQPNCAIHQFFLNRDGAAMHYELNKTEF